jgi:pimeloyl-ACP methyl ester carboxylesterase
VKYTQGTADKTVQYKYAARIQALIPGSELITIERGGHDLTVSHPQVVVSSVVRWFSDDRIAVEPKRTSWF